MKMAFRYMKWLRLFCTHSMSIASIGTGERDREQANISPRAID